MLKNYEEQFITILKQCTVTVPPSLETEQPISVGVEHCLSILLTAREQGRNIFFIGNGASASIASHIGTDFVKTLGMKGIHLGDSSLLTCMGNDLGYEQVYAYPLSILANTGDILIAISSSGQSKNILQATKIARQKGCTLITLSGFEPTNPLRHIGDVNFYVPSTSYGFVEIIHTYMLHWVVDHTKSTLGNM